MKTKRICKSTVSLLLAFMMLVSMLTVGIVSAGAAETDLAETGATITLYFTRPTDNPNWGSNAIYYYCWNTSTNAKNAEWPGQAATFHNNNSYGQSVYKVSVDNSTYDRIIFNNNGSNQTTDIDITGLQDGDQIYYENGSLVVPEHETTTPYDFTFTTDEDRVVYLVDSAGWGQAACYVYEGGSGAPAWPGTVMESVGTHNGSTVYKYTVPDGYTKLIFNNNNNGTQTGNLTFQSYSYYDNETGLWTTVGVTEDDDTGETEPYYLVGETIGWTAQDSYHFTGATANSVTVTLNAGTHKFKIRDNNDGTEYTVASADDQEYTGTVTVTMNNSASTGSSLDYVVETAGDYTFDFDPDTMQLTITPPETGGGDDDGGDDEVVTDKLYFAMVNEIHYFEVTVKCLDENKNVLEEAYLLKEMADESTNRIAARVKGELAEWGDSVNKEWSVYSVDIPEGTHYIHFDSVHNSSPHEEYWHMPKGNDAVDIDAPSDVVYDYHNLYTTNYVYDYNTELFVLYEYDTGDSTGADNRTKGYRSIRKTHDEFFKEETYSVTAECVVQDKDDYDNIAVIDPSGSSAKLGESDIDWTYDVYVNGEPAPNGTGLSSDETYSYEMTEPDTTYEFYIVVTPILSETITATSDTVTASYIEADDSSLTADFTGDKDDEYDNTVIITPQAFFEGVELDRSDYTYIVFDDEGFVSDEIAGTEDYEYTILQPEYNYYVSIRVYYNGDQAASPSQPFVYWEQGETEYVTFSVGLKSSTSYRYIPTVSVNGEAKQDMTQGEFICYNANKTQDYYWYWANITVEAGVDAKITFYNKYNVGGATCTVPSDRIEGGVEYKFGYDNLNYGNTAVWYDPEVYTNDAVISFVETATHMVATSTESATLAQTNVGGTTYFMGDADCDGTLSILDATAIQLALAQKQELTPPGEQLGDYSTNNELDIFDVTIIQLKLAN